MRLTHIETRDFRCLECVDIEPGPGINIISGKNASGKTSLLESIFMLGRGETFRGTAVGSLVRRGQSGLTVAGRTLDEKGRQACIRVIRHNARLQYKLNNQTHTRRFDLVSALPIQLIDPNLHRLMEQGPRFRRRFLDWGVFHVEQRFFHAWQVFRRALRQRNSALRRGDSVNAIRAWDQELIRSSEIIDALRRRHVSQLTALLPATIVRILGRDALTISYRPGWNEDIGLATTLQSSLERDRRAGHTHVGPHRADLAIRVHGVAAQGHVSRGQQKVLAAGLFLAQVQLLVEQTGTSPVLLVDDIAAELGADYLTALLQELERLGVQCFVTALDAAALVRRLVSPQMFHVEHGRMVEP